MCFDDIRERRLLGPELISRIVDAVSQTRKHMLAAQDRQKKWADNHRRQLNFEVEDHVFLKISPIRGTIRFGTRGKLSPRYIGPFDIIGRVGETSYKLALPPLLAQVHNVFHVSLLRKHLQDEKHIIDYSELSVGPDLTVEAGPVSILNKREKQLKNKTIKLVRVLWDLQLPGESTGNLKTGCVESIHTYLSNR